jgi:hypothetical protein
MPDDPHGSQVCEDDATQIRVATFIAEFLDAAQKQPGLPFTEERDIRNHLRAEERFAVL